MFAPKPRAARFGKRAAAAGATAAPGDAAGAAAEPMRHKTLFNRFDLDSDLAVRLQRGLPVGASAEVSITAVDRNYVNWQRGGNFNPSGVVRVPSLRGAGTGVLGSTYRRSFTIQVGEPDPGGQICEGVTIPEL